MRGQIAAVGVGLTDKWNSPGFDPLDQVAVAVGNAARDAGIAVSEIDGLFVSTLTQFMPTLSVAEYLGIQPRFMDGTNIGGSSFVGHLVTAALALQAGLCTVACICYGSNQRSAGGKLATLAEPLRWEAPYGPRNPLGSYALATARHMHEFGTTREQLAEVAVAARQWAQLNPQAQERDPLSIEDVLNARMIADPLTLRDCCLVTDGGGAVILVKAERAKDFPNKPVYLLGAASATTHRRISEMADLTRTAAINSGARAFQIAGVETKDIDVLQLYDAFTINVLLFLEDLGFCAKGEGGDFVRDVGIGPKGTLPVNTNGGGLSCNHPGMYGIFTIVETILQLRGDAAGRQIEGAELGLAHGNGGVLSSQATAIFGVEAVL